MIRKFEYKQFIISYSYYLISASYFENRNRNKNN